MTTTGELRAIIEELELVDIGDAASYLGEELGEGLSLAEQQALTLLDAVGLLTANEEYAV